MLHINITKSSKKKTNLLLARSAMSAAQGCCVADDERATPGNGAASGQLSLSLCRESRVSLAAATKAASPVLRFASSLSLSSRLRAHPEKRRRARADDFRLRSATVCARADQLQRRMSRGPCRQAT